MPELPLTGGCACGAVRFEVTAQPVEIGYCHCTRCQRRTGTAASPNASVRASAFKVLQGEELIASWAPPDGAEKMFCSACSSGLWSASALWPEWVAVRLGAFDADPEVAPSYRQFVDYAAPWEPIPDDGVPRYPERRPR